MTDADLSLQLYSWFWICCGALICIGFLIGLVLWIWMVNDLLKNMDKDERDTWWWLYILGGPFSALIYYYSTKKKKDGVKS